jgi:hypothetical protein
MTARTRHRIRSSRGQSILEFALILPVILLMVLGLVDLGWALLDQHVVTRLAREGSNLISRDVSLQDAVTAIKNMSTRPVDLDNGSKIIFSVIKKGGTIGTANYNRDVLYQRYEYGTLPAQSVLSTAGSGSFGSGPNYEAANSDNDTSLRVTNMPVAIGSAGGMIYVTEIFTTHTTLTPLQRFGVNVPQTLYSIAYF